jgi:sulfur carrier protein
LRFQFCSFSTSGKAFGHGIGMTNLRTKEIQIVVNGQVRRVPEGQTLAQLLVCLDIAGDRVAVELDRKIVRRQEWDATTVDLGATLEIVQFVGGG